MPVWKPEGLSAQTRSAEDQKQITMQGSDFREPVVTTDSLKLYPRVDSLGVKKGVSASDFAAAVVANDEATKDFDTLKQKYSDDYNIDTPWASFEKQESYIKEIAQQVSPYFRKYNYTDYLTFDSKDWANLAVEYNARKDVYGEENANAYLQNEIQRNVASNQGPLEKLWNGFRGMGASTAGALTSVYGNISGGINYLLGNGEKVEGLNGWQNFVNNVMDNDITRYGDDIVKYGTWRRDKIDDAKNRFGGISEIPILATPEQEQTIFNINTIPTALSQGGFTLATIMIGAGEAKLAGWGFRGLKAATLAGKTGNTVQKLNQARNTLQAIQRAEKINNTLILPALAGTHEGLIEGLNTKLSVLEDGKAKLAEQQDKAVTKRAIEILSENPNISVDEAKQLAFAEYSDKYNQSLEQIEIAASKAGINNFYANSAINGILNATLKAGLQAPTVQGALQKSRLTSWVFPKTGYAVSGSAGSATVAPKYGKFKMAFDVAKEPMGEFTEEYLQSISDAAMAGAGNYNITKFIENKYSGDAEAQVGDHMAGEMAAGWTALENALTDKETIKSGIYGALSSILGTPSMRVRDYTSRVKQSDGTYKTQLNFRKREGESTLGYVSRLAPWRSGLANSIREVKAEYQQANDEAKLLQDWINNPINQAKFDGVAGTTAWARDMETSGATNDEFGYRNSVLGKTINDAVMLEKLKGTAFYESYMNALVTSANVERGTEAANVLINSVKQDVNTADSFSGMSDDDILNTIKKNANSMLNTINTIQNESDSIDRTLGNVDEDTKISLIFGKMSIDNWKERAPKLEETLKGISSGITDTVEKSSLTDKQKSAIGTFGSYKKALTAVESMKKRLTDLNEDIKNLSSRKGLVKAETDLLRQKTAEAKSLKSAIAKFESADSTEDYEEISKQVLSESEIMALPADARAAMLNPENLGNYSEAQQAVIANLLESGTAIDSNFKGEIQDAGRMEIATKSFLKQYNSILSDPSAFNRFVARQKLAANDILTKQKYEGLSSITDYTKFANELDKIMDSGSQREQAMIFRALEDSENELYAKYKNERETLSGLFNQIVEDNEFTELDANDKDMLAHTLAYLSNHGIDLKNQEEVAVALMEQDANGNSLFKQYVEDVNKDLPLEEQTAFTSIEEAISNYQRVLANYLKDTTDAEKVKEPVAQEPTSPAESAPAAPVTPEVKPEPKIAGEPEPKVTKSVEDVSKEEQPLDPKSPVAVALNVAKNLLRVNADSRVRATDIINNLSEQESVTPEEFGQQLLFQANRISTNSADPIDLQTADILRQASNRVNSNAQTTPITDLISEGKPKQNVFAESSANAAVIESLDMDYVTKKYPDSALAKYYKKYGISNYLLKDAIKKDTPIMFIVDQQLANNCKQEMEESGRYYTINSIPIVAVVEVQDGGITLTINGETKHVQPIAIMPATDNQKQAGAARLNKLRQLAVSGGESIYGKPLEDEDGNIIITNMSGNVVAKAPNQLDPLTDDNRSAQILGVESLDADERTELESIPSKAERRKSPIYRRLKEKFLSRLGVEESKVGKQLVYRSPSLKLGQEIPISAFITPVQRSYDRNSDMTIAQLFNSNASAEAKLDANSRIRRAARELSNFFSRNFNTEDMTFEMGNDGQIIATPSTQTLLDTYAKRLEDKISNFLNLPSKAGWRYTITPTENLAEEGERVFTLSIVDNNDVTIPLGNVSRGAISIESQAAIISNLLLDENGNVRMRNPKDSFVIWNVNYADVANPEVAAKNNMSDIYDDDIIDFSKDALDYTVRGVKINAPFTLEGKPNYFVAETNQKQVATPAVFPSNVEQAKSGEAIVDGDSGAIIQGTPKEAAATPVRQQGAIRDRRRKATKPLVVPTARTIPSNLAWGVWEGSALPISEIFESLKARGIETKEQWDSRTNEEMEHELQCCGASHF